MKKKTLTFIIALISPLLPVLAILIFNRIGNALPLLIICAIMVVLVSWSIVALIGVNEKSPGMKIIGTFVGVIGIFITAAVGFISGWAYTKI
jgi:predicted permease